VALHITPLLCLLAVAAAEVPAAPETPATPAAVAAAPPLTWYAFASPFYLPETRVGLGAIGGVHFGLCAGCETSSVHVEAAYTLNQQLSLALASRAFVSESFTMGMTFGYALFPSRFYGIGPTTSGVGEKFTPRSLDLLLTPEEYVIPRRLRIGPKLHLRREEIVSREADKLLATGSVYGSDGYQAVGLGASATWDSRDSEFLPRRGTYAQAWYLYYPGTLGHHRDFGRGAVEGSWFVPLGGDHVLGLNGSVAFANGDPPFTLLANLGGARSIRGYEVGRYRDRFSYGLQTEYRFPITWRLRGAAFAGAGSVAPTPTAVDASTLRPAAGAGLRLRLTDDGVHLRADVASNGRDSKLYLIVLEAF
jgi:hypothetical protein